MSAGSRNFLVVVFSLGLLGLGLITLGKPLLTDLILRPDHNAFAGWSAQAAAPAVQPPHFGDAIAICERFVTNELKAPSTAQFSRGEETQTVNNSGYTWTVRGWVDSQNGFGAQIRSNYECRARFTGRSGNTLNWTREAMTITQR